MSLITKPKLENRQFEQPSNSTLDMGGTTNFLGVLKSKNIEIDASISGDTIDYDGFSLIFDNQTKKIILKKNNLFSSEIVLTEDVNYTINHDIGYIGVSGNTTTINLPSEPIDYIEYTITDLRGNAGDDETNNITINGNGKLINGETSAIIDTNYGSFTFKYSGSFWYIISLYF